MKYKHVKQEYFFKVKKILEMRADLFLSETLEETIESGPLCITDLFQNKISL